MAEVPFESLPAKAQTLRASSLQHQRGLTNFTGENSISRLREVSTIPGDSLVKLQWPVAGNNFSGYIIERSADGGNTYDSLTSNIYISEPQVLTDSLGNELGTAIVYHDSPVPNYQRFRYRITAFDAFGDRSQPGIIHGMARDMTAPKNPELTSATYLEDRKQIQITWRLSEIPDDFADLHIEYAESPDSTFVRLESESLDPRDSVYYHTPLPNEVAHYFRMGLVDTAGNASYSFPLFVNVPDTIPPLPPVNLSAKIDTTGQVNIHWEDELPDKEGFLGYRVFASNHPRHEFTQLTVKPVPSNFYVYHIPVKTLTEKIYFKVQAVDKHYNHSEFSEILEAEKPDLIAPVAPVMMLPKGAEDYIEVSWQKSASKDVVRQILTRTTNPEEAAVKFTLDSEATSFQDTSAIAGTVYRYAILAEDDAGNLSPSSLAVKGRMIDRKRMSPAQDLQLSFNEETREISLIWSYSDSLSVASYTIYRNINDERVKRYASAENNKTSFSDKIRSAGTYYYAIKVFGQQGEKSLLSDWVSIEIGE